MDEILNSFLKLFNGFWADEIIESTSAISEADLDARKMAHEIVDEVFGKKTT